MSRNQNVAFKTVRGINGVGCTRGVQRGRSQIFNRPIDPGDVSPRGSMAIWRHWMCAEGVHPARQSSK